MLIVHPVVVVKESSVGEPHCFTSVVEVVTGVDDVALSFVV